MKINEFITEATYGEKNVALQQLYDLFRRAVANDPTPITAEEVTTVKATATKLAKFVGRGFSGYVKQGKNPDVGYMYARINEELNKLLHKAGKLNLPTTGSSIGAFASQIATFFSSLGARVEARHAMTWRRSDGAITRDPGVFVRFNNEEDLDMAYDTLAEKGKRIYVKDHPENPPHPYIQIGKILIAKHIITYGAFGNNPSSRYSLAFQTTGILKNAYRQQADITDQQAAQLRDIAATRDASAMAKIKLMMAAMNGKDEMTQLINNSKKVTPQDKAKLDAIIAGAANFKEP